MKCFWITKAPLEPVNKVVLNENPAVEHMNKNCPEMPKEFGEDGIIWRFEM